MSRRIYVYRSRQWFFQESYLFSPQLTDPSANIDFDTSGTTIDGLIWLHSNKSGVVWDLSGVNVSWDSDSQLITVDTSGSGSGSGSGSSRGSIYSKSDCWIHLGLFKTFRSEIYYQGERHLQLLWNHGVVSWDYISLTPVAKHTRLELNGLHNNSSLVSKKLDFLTKGSNDSIHILADISHNLELDDITHYNIIPAGIYNSQSLLDIFNKYYSLAQNGTSLSLSLIDKKIGFYYLDTATVTLEDVSSNLSVDQISSITYQQTMSRCCLMTV